MEMKFVKPILDGTAMDKFFEEVGIQIPEAFQDFFIENNGGRPINNQCMLLNGNEKILNTFLSFNESDKENVYKARRRVEVDDMKLIPFANDPSGNYFCIKDGRVIFYSHEDSEEMEICDSFDAFIRNF